MFAATNVLKTTRILSEDISDAFDNGVDPGDNVK
jgi:hypothetical protein